MIYNGIAHIVFAKQTGQFVSFSNTIYLNSILFFITFSETQEGVLKNTYMFTGIVLIIYTSIFLGFMAIEDYMRITHNEMYMGIINAMSDVITGCGGKRNIHVTAFGFQIYSNGINVLTENDLDDACPTYTLENDEKCPVCLELLSGLGRKLGCNHEFHAICIDSWVLKAGHCTCPLCRSSILT